MSLLDRSAMRLLSDLAQPGETEAPRSLSVAAIAGQLNELSGLGDTAGLTETMRLVLDAQQQGENVVWITLADSTFFPVDAAENGVDLDALIVVRVPDAAAASQSADRLVRSGAFGLLVLDLGSDAGLAHTPFRPSRTHPLRDGRPAVLLYTGPATLPLPRLARLAGLAHKHHTAIVCVTHKAESAPSLGSLVALRGSTRRERVAPDRFTCALRVLKDKRRGPWAIEEIYRGPVGLR